MAMAYPNPLNLDLSPERIASLKQGIAMRKADPTLIPGSNYSPGMAAIVADQENELNNIYGQLNQNQTRQDIQDSTPNPDIQRNAIDQIFGNQQAVQTQNLNNLFNTQRGNAIEEAAALGNLRQPGFQASTLNNIDAQKSQAMAQLLGSLGGAQGQARSGLESDIAGRGLQKAGLLQQGNQFGQTFGLQQNQFGANQRQQNLENLFNQQALDQAGQLGRMQADAQKPDAWDRFGQVTGGIGNLLGGAAKIYGASKGMK